MLRHRPLRDDPEAPKGVYLHEAVTGGPDAEGLATLLLRSGSTLTELDANLDTPLGSFLRQLVHENRWTSTWRPQVSGGQAPGVRRKECRRLATKIGNLIQLLWTKDIDVQARNKGDKSIRSYLTSLRLYEGDGGRNTCMVRQELASHLQQRVKVVTVAGGDTRSARHWSFCRTPTRPSAR